jgi:hypothetical protein
VAGWLIIWRPAADHTKADGYALPVRSGELSMMSTKSARMLQNPAPPWGGGYDHVCFAPEAVISRLLLLWFHHS